MADPKAATPQETDPFKRAVMAVGADIDGEMQAGKDPSAAPAEAAPADGSSPFVDQQTGLTPEQMGINDPGSPAYGTMDMVAGGAAKAFFNAKDLGSLILGQGGTPDYEDKSALRQDVEKKMAIEKASSTPNALVAGISEFGVGWLGTAPLKAYTGVKLAGTMIRSGIAAGVAMDPQADRLSNFLEQYPGIQQPVFSYLASKPGDGQASSRFKNAIENMLLPAAGHLVISGGIGAVRGLTRAFTSSVESVKLNQIATAVENGTHPDPGSVPAPAELRAQAAVKAEEADKGFAQVQKKGTLDGRTQPEALPTDTPTPPPEAPAPVEGTPLPRWQQRRLDRAERGKAPASDPANPSGVDEAPPQGPKAVEGEAAPQGEGVAPRPVEGGPVPVPGDSRAGVLAPDTAASLAASEPMVTAEQVAKGLAAVEGDVAAVGQGGSVGAAQAAGHVFSGEDLIPWNKFTARDDVMTWMDSIVHDNVDLIHAARGGNAAGVMADAQVEKVVGQWAKATQQDPAMVMGLIKQAGQDAPQFVAKMETAYLIAQKGFQDTFLLAQKVAQGNFEGFASTELAHQAVRDRMGAALDMFAAGKAMTAAGARATRRMGFGMDAADWAKIDLNGMTGDELTRLIVSTNGDPQAMAAITRPLINRVVDFATFNQAAGLLWGWATHTAGTVANVGNLYLRPGIQWGGAAFLRGSAALRGDADMLASAGLVARQARKELLVTSSTLRDGWEAAKFAFMNGDSKLAPHSSEVTAAGAGATSRPGSGPLADMVNVWRDVKGMDDVIHNALTSTMQGLSLPLRALGAADEMVRTMRYRAIVIAKADIEALEAGLKPGSQEYADHLTLRGRQAFSPEGAALDVEALNEARATTFQEQLLGTSGTGPSGVGGAMGKALDALGGESQTFGGYASAGRALQAGVAMVPPLRFMAPYVQTPVNIFRQEIRQMPGLNMLQKQYLNDISGASGVARKARATGEMMMGILYAGLGTQMALNGQITGAGPTDPKDAKAWREAGNMPDSIVFTHADGHKSYFQISRFNPITAPLIWFAEITTYLKQGNVDENKLNNAATAAVLATMNLLKNQTMLANMGQVFDAVTNEDKLNTWAKRAVPGMLLPASSLLKMVNPDPYLREVNSILDGIKNDVPGWSTTLPLAHDPFGDKVTIPGKFTSEQGQQANGLESDAPKYAPLYKALDENFAATGHYIQNPNPRQGPANIDTRDLKLESGETAYSRLSELAGHPKGAPSLKETLLRITSSEAFQKLPHGYPAIEGNRENVIQSTISKYHQGAVEALKAESKIFRDATMKAAMDQYGRLQATVKNPSSVAGNAAAKSINDLLGRNGTGLSVPVPPVVPQ